MNAHNEQHIQSLEAAKKWSSTSRRFKAALDAGIAALAAQPAAAQEAVGWFTDDYLTDKSATTYDPLVAERWRNKGWPVTALYAATVAAAPVDGRDVRSAIAGLEGSVAVGSDGEWVSVRRAARDAAVMALRNVSLDCAHIYAAYSEAKASTPAAPGIDLATAWAEGYRSGVTDERISESNIGISGFGAKIEPARANPYMIDASPKDELESWKRGTKACAEVLGQVMRQTQDSPKGGSEVVSDAMIHAALRVQYARAGSLWTGSEANPDFTDMRHILSAAMQAQAGDAEVRP